jgi:3-oxoadipate enol-lactonase
VAETLGYECLGSGPVHVVILNDYLSDTSSWDGARTYLDLERFTFVFVDLRGYGRSRKLTGAFTLAEAAADVLALADAMGLARFALIGHSMSALIALHLAQHHADRIESTVLLAPSPPRGFGADDATIAAGRALALADEPTQLAAFRERFGTRLSPMWVKFKLARWRHTAAPEAAASYFAMFARAGVPDPTARVTVPVLVVTGEQDAPPMRSAAVTETLRPLCDQLTVTPLADAGHYPMQEMPPLTVALIERFLESAQGSAPPMPP